MRVENLSIALRPRTAWEAVDLGVALTRRHARTVWLAWFAFTLPALALATTLCWLAFDAAWAGALIMWWAKPLFDRIPVYVLSRAVFGEVPGVRETLRAQFRWNVRPIGAWLLYRRFFSFNRAMLLPVDLLEGPAGPARGARIRVLASGEGSQGIMLTIIAMHVEAMLVFSLFALALMFVPVEFLPDSAKAMWDTLIDSPPAWAQGLSNLVAWTATSIVEPFYVGAGFGLYLNRRTHLEAWDIELAFRRLAARIAAPALCVLLALAPHATTWAAEPEASDWQVLKADEVDGDEETEEAEADADRIGGQAQAPDPAPELPAGEQSPASVAGSALAGGGARFTEAVQRAYAEPELDRKRTEMVWVERGKGEEDPDREPGDRSFATGAIAAVAAAIAESALWILLAIGAILLLRFRHVWLPWLGAAAALARREPPALEVAALERPAAPDVPADVPSAVRALWARGERRAALALLYRAAVQRLVEARGAALPPGATESECLRAARALRGWSFGDGFARIVASWRAAAYARRLPEDAQLDALLAAYAAGAAEQSP